MAFPTAVRRGGVVGSTTDANTWTPSVTFGALNTAISAGERVLWVAVVSSDQAPTISETGGGWTKIGQASNGSIVTGAIFVRETTDGYAAGAWPGIVLGTTTSEQFSIIVLAFKAGSGKQLVATSVTATSANGSSTNSNPASITNGSGATRDMQLIVTRSGDSTTVATVAPTNYSQLQTIAGGGTFGASTNTAERQLSMASAASDDPGTFTSGSEQWATWTLGYYEVNAPIGLVPADMSTQSLAENVALAPKTALIVAGSASASTAANVALAGSVALVPAGSASTTTAANGLVNISPIPLTVQGSASKTQSRGLAGDGPDLLSSLNGQFITDVAGWVTWNGGAFTWIAGGKARITGPAIARRAVPTIQGVVYRLTAKVDVNGGQFIIAAGGDTEPGFGNDLGQSLFGTTGTVSYEFTANTSGARSVGMQMGGTDVADIDYFELREADAIVLSSKTTLIVNGAASASTADNVTISPKTTLTVQGSSSTSDDFGPNLVVDSGFDNAGSWTSTNPAVLTVIGSVADFVNAASGVNIHQTLSGLSAGQQYYVSYDVVAVSLGGFRSDLTGNVGVTVTTVGPTGSYITDTGANDIVRVRSIGTTTGQIDNLRVRLFTPIVLSPKTTLTPAGSASATTAANVVLEMPGTLVVQNAASATTAANVTITPKTALTVQNAASASTSANVTLSPKTVLAPQGSASATTAGSPTLSPKTALVPASAASATTAANVTIAPKTILIVAGTASLTTAANVIISPKTTLVPASAASPTTAANVLLAPKWSLFPAAAASATSAESPTLVFIILIVVLEGNEVPVFYPDLSEHEKQVWPSSYVTV